MLRLLRVGGLGWTSSRDIKEGWPISEVARGPKDHRSTRISHSGSKGQFKGDTRNHILLADPYVYVVLWGPCSSAAIRRKDAPALGGSELL